VKNIDGKSEEVKSVNMKSGMSKLLVERLLLVKNMLLTIFKNEQSKVQELFDSEMITKIAEMKPKSISEFKECIRDKEIEEGCLVKYAGYFISEIASFVKMGTELEIRNHMNDKPKVSRKRKAPRQVTNTRAKRGKHRSFLH